VPLYIIYITYTYFGTTYKILFSRLGTEKHVKTIVE
jgi:hypothetical protein